MKPTDLLVAVVAITIAWSGPIQGKQQRSNAAKSEFKRQQPCPSTGHHRGSCPGWIIDHIQPLACGGADAPANMQWQTVADAKAKDQWERKGCHAT